MKFNRQSRPNLRLVTSEEEFHHGAWRHGEVLVKVGKMGGRVINAAPEYESAAAVARASGVPLKTVMDEARRAFDAQEEG